jgi:hypothetical protein
MHAPSWPWQLSSTSFLQLLSIIVWSSVAIHVCLSTLRIISCKFSNWSLEDTFVKKKKNLHDIFGLIKMQYSWDHNISASHPLYWWEHYCIHALTPRHHKQHALTSDYCFVWLLSCFWADCAFQTAVLI